MSGNIYQELTQAFNAGRLRAILSSGQAVVMHRLAVMSKDGDWILGETPAVLVSRAEGRLPFQDCLLMPPRRRHPPRRPKAQIRHLVGYPLTAWTRVQGRPPVPGRVSALDPLRAIRDLRRCLPAMLRIAMQAGG
ncbi:MAG: hypothetical protein WCI03_03895 [bacterium]|jgi:hypothetical protein